MLKGYMTYVTVAVGVIFSIGRLFGIEFGVPEEAFTEAIGTIILVALAFLRRGVKNGG